ncbi:cGMP-dependent protein kinase egl-4-like isoform X2 [Sitophilus oryzae]|nr:cGMP-dependent protein kinase egl-4-like isoform X2 [Sitophilus oryzae]
MEDLVLLKMTLKKFYKKHTNRYKIVNDENRKPGILEPLVQEKQDKHRNTYKTEVEKDEIFQTLEQNEFLKNIMAKSHINELIDCMYNKELHEGEYLLEENKIYSQLYILRKGTFEVLENGKSEGKYNDRRIFGEVAILHSSKASHSVKALEKGEVWVLDSSDFKRITINDSMEKQDEIVKFLKNVPRICEASNDKLYRLADLVTVEKYEGSKILIKEGDVTNKFFIIAAGSATLLCRHGAKKDRKIFRGDFFGEEIFLKEVASICTVITDAVGIECLVLSRETFLKYFNDLEDFFYKKPDEELNIHYVELQNLKKLKTLGRGGFGKVVLVQDRQNKENLYALKYLAKHEIVGKSQRDQVYNEKHLQIQCDNNFIVKLYQTFKDSKYIYFLQEPCMGGDLWNLLRRQKKKCFESDTAKFYSACVVEAFGYLHSKDIVYRDLKPENVMVCSNGYIKLTDFGFAKKIPNQDHAVSFVGTAEYISPEIILSKPHDKGVDYWALGIFIYEMLVGYTPFKNSDHNDEKTYKAILKGIDFATFPAIISPRARNLIKKLCRPLSIDRIGCQKNGVDDIRIHPWFSKVDWEKLGNLEVEPPILICLNGKSDTRYFDYVKDKDHEVAVDDFTTWDKDF